MYRLRRLPSNTYCCIAGILLLKILILDFVIQQIFSPLVSFENKQNYINITFSSCWKPKYLILRVIPGRYGRPTPVCCSHLFLVTLRFKVKKLEFLPAILFCVLGYLLGSCGWLMERMRCLDLFSFIIIYLAFKNLSGTGREMLF